MFLQRQHIAVQLHFIIVQKLEAGQHHPEQQQRNDHGKCPVRAAALWLRSRLKARFRSG
ncbi:hypothetical protein D3C73_769140 [compost metagenome]